VPFPLYYHSPYKSPSAEINAFPYFLERIKKDIAIMNTMKATNTLAPALNEKVNPE
jgi:hypothetical protein